MPTAPPSDRPRGLKLALNRRRVRFTLLVAAFFGLILSTGWNSGFLTIMGRTLFLGLNAMLVFGLFEQWPKRLPRWLARWVLQVVAVAVSMPFATLIIYQLSTPAGTPNRHEGLGTFVGVGVLVAPWVALGALVRQREALVRNQLERQALDARLRLLQAQVAPHFLFNTLANVQALVDAGSPRASEVLRSLIAYLRAAVPRLNEPTATFRQELDLVRAYLDLMHLRMPDRLSFAIHADEAALDLRCPPLTILTLVENAVRHGLDPDEEGGRIDITVQRRAARCHVRVSDTGLGFGTAAGGLGTGLSTLRERLSLVFGGDAALTVSAQQPRGVSAEIDIPATGGTQ
jgi:two-component sensor histidine kinase